ncbi:MAG TPA: site-2 protease family protein [Pirellulales bacterium]|nr:site-2 protease family protein [Pirellulales bacterium]
MDQPLFELTWGHFALLGTLMDTLHWVLPILGAAVALGFVIFVHELGHFVVAKLCGVKCEKFFLGFDIAGKKLWSVQWGETEYGIGVLPLGGYVKMLGQDDNPASAAEERERAKAKSAAAAQTAASATPEQIAAAEAAANKSADAQRHSGAGLQGDIPHEPTAEDHEAFDPRSYMAKSVPQRMAIISAGVIMNLIFAVIFATVAYRWGVSYIPCVVGEAIPGDPAWTQGIRPGDRIVQFNHDKPSQHLRFDSDLMMGVLFTGAGNDLRLMIDRPPINPQNDAQADGKPKRIELTVRPTDAHKAEQGGRSVIGVAPASSNQLALVSDSASPTFPDTPAAEAKPALKGGDWIVAASVDSENHPLENGVQIEALLAQHADEQITFSVSRDVPGNPPPEPEKLAVTLAPTPLHSLGIVMQMGPIAAVQDGSPAAAAGLRAGDVIESVGGKPVDDPLRLPDELAKLAGKPIAIEIRRTEAGHESKLTLHPTLRAPLDYNRIPSTLYNCDALGIAYPVSNVVAAVLPDASAGAKTLQPGDKILSAQFLPTDDEKKQFAEGPKFPTEPLKLTDGKLSWPDLAAAVQIFPTGVKVKLTYQRGEKGADQVATVNTISVPGAHFPGRGFLLQPMMEIRKTDSWTEAGRLGWRETKESVMQIVTTLRKVVSGGVSPNGLGGPGTIAVVAADSAKQGIPKLLIFLTLLSANLAVINFLPIPILDGGHMMFLLYEGIRGKPASERVQMYLTYLGLVFILTLMIFVIGLDISRLVHWIMSLF